MRYLEGDEYKGAMEYLEYAAEVGKHDAACLRSKCGSIVVIDGEIVGAGANSLPGNKAPYVCRKDHLPCDFKSDKTCCVHAEQRAIIDTISKKGSCDKYGNANTSVIYFVRLDDKDNIKKSGKPYCTICSKMCLEVGIKEFVMLTKEGIVSYPMDEFNEESFKYREN